MVTQYLLARVRLPAIRRSTSQPHFRLYGTVEPRAKSAYAQWYSEIVPAMIPVFLLGSAVYLGLQLSQLKLSHERYMEQATQRVRELEAEVDVLQKSRSPLVTTSTVQEPQPRKSRWWWLPPAI
ncbi:hypothetical protein BD779DRAFT_371119 [Infundibulicybe gibba]|nr:hypothetical protein BD779DRAFT_371119 [Infundibulicybe gibba]